MADTTLNEAEIEMLRRVERHQPGKPAYGPALQKLSGLGFIYWVHGSPKIAPAGKAYLNR